MRAMILAAGLGTRLRPLTNWRAKPALPVRGRPVISLLLEMLAAQGIREVLVNLHHLPDSIRRAIASDSPSAIDVTWSEEPVPLGTGGGIRRAADFLAGTPDCLVLAGDMLFDADLERLLDAHRRSGRAANLVLKSDRRGADFGTIGLDESSRVTRIGRRMLPASAGEEASQGLFTGVRLLSREVFAGWPPAEAFEDLRDWLAPRAEAGEIALGGLDEPGVVRVWEPVGTPNEYLAANLTPPALPSLGGLAERWQGSIVDPSASIGADSILDDCVVWDNETIPAGSRFSRGVFAGGRFHAFSNESLPEADPRASTNACGSPS